jgi:hypothetical protein
MGHVEDMLPISRSYCALASHAGVFMFMAYKFSSGEDRDYRDYHGHTANP